MVRDGWTLTGRRRSLPGFGGTSSGFDRPVGITTSLLGGMTLEGVLPSETPIAARASVLLDGVMDLVMPRQVMITCESSVACRREES